METNGNISQSQYIAITSGVGGASAATEKELCARVVSENQKVPTDTVLEFAGIDAVGAFFGTDTPEYKYASRYFGFISKSVRKPRKIGFYRSTLQAVAPFIYPSQKAAALGQFKNVSDGSFTLSMGGLTYTVSGLDFSNVADYASIANILQTAIRANADGGELWTGATVAFNTQDSVITLVGGAVGSAVLVAPVAAETGTDITSLLGWDIASAPFVSQGKEAQSVTDLMAKNLNLSNNFGTFLFLPTLTVAQITEAAQYTHAQNVQFKFTQRVTPTNYLEVQQAVAGYNGVCLVYDLYEDNTYPTALDAAIWAAADYNAVNGAPGAEFQKDSTIPASVFDDATYKALTGLKINFVGRTQQAGQPITFYQPGYLQGDIEDEGVYMNEVWLKDKFVTAVLNTQLALEKWPTGDDGITLFDSITLPIRNLAKTNGVVALGKTLTDNQKVYITQLTGDAKAWQQVQSQGDYITRSIAPEQKDGVTVYVLSYRYIYSKGDQVRFVDGSHILI